MKILQLLLAVIFLAAIGGFGFFAFVDVPVAQQDVSKEIPHERLAGN